MAAVWHIFTLARAAETLEIDEDTLSDLAQGMQPEDGCVFIWGTGEMADGVTGFTPFGIENLQEQIDRKRRDSKPGLR